MEMANHPQTPKNNQPEIRAATKSDLAGVMDLLQATPYRHVHVDWYLPGEWIGSPGFVVQTKREGQTAVSSKLFGAKDKIQACFAATADPLPAAWVRVTAVSPELDPKETLRQLMPPVMAYLQSINVTEMGWLSVETWPNEWIAELGFDQQNEIITYRKEDVELPPTTAREDILIRPVEPNDFDRLAAIEEAAYTPLWRHSTHALKMAYSQRFSFDVVIYKNVVVGFQLSVRGQQSVHLARLTIDPAYQKKGIGSALLAHTLAGYHNRGMVVASLNTQKDNIASQFLYRKFGFISTQDIFPVWVMNL